MRYSNSVAIIAGGSSGIGKALAQRLLGEGAKVVITSRTATKAQRIAEEIGQRFPGQSVGCPLDVTDEVAVKAVVERALNQFGRLDFMFNNAGAGVMGAVLDLESKDWRQMIDINFFGVVHGVNAAYPVMVKQGRGHIINTASLSGLVALPATAPYTASKFAVVGLSKALRAEAARFGVRVSVVCPAAVDTPIYDAGEYRGIDKAAFMRSLPGTMITPESCAESILEGVRRNRAVITPGKAASVIAWLDRFVPGFTFAMGRSFDKKMRELRERPVPRLNS